jgi:REP element-mobilizing transposase RayT
MRQQTIEFRTWGGRRAGAGRKPSGRERGAVHEARPAVGRSIPQHLTMRVRGVPSLRSERCMKVIRHAFAEGKERFGFRLVQYAVQPDHLHLIVEAAGKKSLSSGARGLAIRVAMRLNRLLGRAGKVFAERYHAVALGSPKQVRNALAYVLLQERRHAAKRRSGLTTELDACSSAFTFDGWADASPRAGPWDETVAEARSWLLSKGWRRYGRIRRAEVPGAA